MADEVQNLQIQQQINDVIAQRAAMLDANTDRLTTQVQLALELCKAMDCEDLEGAVDRLDAIRNGMRNAETQSRQMATTMSQGAADSAKSYDGLTKHITATTGAGIGFVVGLKNAWDALIERGKAIGSFFGSIISSVWGLGKAILMAPFSMLSGLIGLANESGGGGGNALRDAYEKVRETWGSLVSNEGKALKNSVIDLRKNARDFAGTGLRLGEIYGRGKAGLAAALEDLMGVADSLGNSFGLLKEEISDNAAAILAYKKGLGISEDAMAALGKRALATGRELTGDAGLLTEMASLAINMGDKFGVSAKRISKDMQVMTEDFSNFGSMSQKELAATAVYAHKLGVEISDMMGVIDKWDNFQDAAKGAAMLAQSFGINVDAMEMMNAQSPAERIDKMRKSFFSAGQSIEGMTRQQRKLLETQTGLTGAALDAAFANENMGLSYEDVKAGAEDAENKQLTQVEAMEKLADSIERVFGGGGGKRFSSFFDALAKGFVKGVARSKPMMKLFRNIRKSLNETFKFGKKLGKMFVDMFPGIKGIAEGLAKLFDPKKFKVMFNELTFAFKHFFHTLEIDPKAAFDNLLGPDGDLSWIFDNFFTSDSKKGAVKQIKDGLMSVFKAAFGILGSLVPMAIKELTKVFKGITEWMKNPSKPGGKGTNPNDSMAVMIYDMIKELGDSIDELMPELYDAFTEMFSLFWDKYGSKLAKYIGAGLLTVVTGAIASLGMSTLMGGAAGGLFDFFGGDSEETKKAKDATKGGPVKPAPMAKKGGFLDSLVEAAKSLSDWSEGEAIVFGKVLRVIAGPIVAAMIVLTGGLISMSALVGQLSWDSLGKGIASMVVVVGSIVGLAWAVNKIGNLNPAEVVLGLGGLALILGVGLPKMIGVAKDAADALPGIIASLIPLGPMLTQFAMGLPPLDVVATAKEKMEGVASIMGYMAAMLVGSAVSGVPAALSDVGNIVAKAFGSDKKVNIFASAGKMMKQMVDGLTGPLQMLANWNIGAGAIAKNMDAVMVVGRAMSQSEGLATLDVEKLNLSGTAIAGGAAALAIGIEGVEAAFDSSKVQGLKALIETLEFMKQVDMRFRDYQSAGAGNVIKGFNTLATEMNEINRALSTQIPMVKVEGVIKKFGQAMKVGKGHVKLAKPAPINVSVHVDLSMNANQIAVQMREPLAKKNLVGSKNYKRLISQGRVEDGVLTPNT